MSDETGKFSFTIPEGFPAPAEADDRKVEKTFPYEKCENDRAALDVLQARVAEDRKDDPKKDSTWTIVALVNARLFAMAKSNAYQAALAAYKTSSLSPEQMREQAIRNLIRIKVPPDKAREIVMGLTQENLEASS